MSLSFDIDQLIDEIHSRPVLWNPSAEFFNRRSKSKEAWLDVAKTVIPDFETLKYSKQHEYLEQLKRKYYCLRGTYRAALMKKQSFKQGPQLLFLNQLWNLPAIEENSIEVGERNVEEAQNNKEEASSAENNCSMLINSLKPVLSIEKIDAARVNKVRSKRGRPKRRQSRVLQMESPKAKKLIRREQPIVDSDDEREEEGGDAKQRKYQCQVRMASVRESSPPRRTSTYASLSFADDRQVAECGILASRNHELGNDRPSHNHNDRPSHNIDSYDDRPHNYDMYNNRPMRERGYSPPSSPSVSMRRQESCFDARRFPIFPTVPLDYHDEDMAFFRSLLTWTKRFSEDEKLEFRSEVMRLISRIRSYESAANYYVLSQTPLS